MAVKTIFCGFAIEMMIVGNMSRVKASQYTQRYPLKNNRF